MVDLPHPDAPISATNSPGRTRRVTPSSTGVAAGPWPNTLVSPSTRTASTVSSVVTVIRSATTVIGSSLPESGVVRGRLALGAQDGVERTQVVDPVEGRRLQQVDAHGVVRRGLQAGGHRVVGDLDVAPGPLDDGRGERLAGQLGEAGVDVPLRRLRVG